MRFDLIDKLIYLDRDFVAGAYEEITGKGPSVQITKSQSMNAGATIPIFSSGISAGETRTFSVSSLGMVRELRSALEELPTIEKKSLGAARPSITGWVTGTLSIFKVVVRENSRERNPKRLDPFGASTYDPIKATQNYFAVHTAESLKLALITTPDYFTSGFEALTELYDTVLEDTNVPVTALVRVIASRSSFGEWIAIPLIMLEEANTLAGRAATAGRLGA